MGKLQCVGSGLNDSDSKWKREIGLSWLLASWYSLNCITATIKHAEIMPELKNILIPALTLEVTATWVSHAYSSLSPSAYLPTSEDKMRSCTPASFSHGVYLPSTFFFWSLCLRGVLCHHLYMKDLILWFQFTTKLVNTSWPRCSPQNATVYTGAHHHLPLLNSCSLLSTARPNLSSIFHVLLVSSSSPRSIRQSGHWWTYLGKAASTYQS